MGGKNFCPLTVDRQKLLSSYCRWATCISSLISLLNNYTTLRNTSEEIADTTAAENDAEVSGYLNQFQTFNNFFALKLTVEIY